MPGTIQTEPETPLADFDAAAHLQALNLERYLKDQEPLPTEAANYEHPQYDEYANSAANLSDAQDRLEGWNYHLSEWASPEEVKETFQDTFRSRLYSPLAWTALRGIDTPGMHGSRLDAAERIEAMQSVEGLVGLVDRYLANNDRSVAGNLLIFEKVAGAERVSAHLDNMATKKPEEILGFNFYSIQRHAGPDRMKQLVQVAADAYLKSPKATLRKEALLDGETLPLLRPDQAKGLAVHLLKTQSTYEAGYDDGLKSSEERSAALDLLQEGLIDEKQLVDGLIALPESEPMLDGLKEALPMYREMLERSGRTADFRVALEKSIEKGYVPIRHIPELPFFTDSEKQSLMLEELKRDTEFGLGAYTELLLQHLPADVIRAEFEAIAPDMAAFSIASMLEQLPDTVMSKEEKGQYLRTAAIMAPAELSEHTPLVAEVFDAEEAGRITADIVENAAIGRNSRLLDRAEDWLPMMGNEEEQRAAFRGLVERSADAGFLSYYVANPNLQALMTNEEMKLLLSDRIAGNNKPLEPFFLDPQERAAFLEVFSGDDQVIVDLAGAAVTRNPSATIKLVMGISEAFTVEQRHDLLLAAAESDPLAVVDEGERALYKLSAAERAHVIALSLELSPGETVARLSWYLEAGRMQADEGLSYLTPLAQDNPALLYMFDGYETVQTKSELLETMRSSDHLRGVVPEWTGGFAKDFRKTNEYGKEILMKEAILVYQNIATVRRFAPEALDSVTRMATNALDQRDALVMLAFTAKYGEAGSLQAFTEGGSMEELADATFRTMEHSMGITMTVAARRQLEPALMPFTVYAERFGRSEGHARVLADFAAADGPEAFRDFRLIANTPEALEQAKADGLLPRSLTLEQHAAWREDDEIVNQEKLLTSADDVADHVKSIIQVAGGQAGLEVKGLDSASVVSLNEGIKALGGQLAELRRMQIVNPMMTSEEKAEQGELITEVLAELSKQQVLIAVVRLHGLSSDEIVSGKLINSDGKKQQPLGTVLDRAHKAVVAGGMPQEARMMLAEIGRVLEDFQQQTDDSRSVRVIDTIDQRTTLEVGAKPIGSCQDYATGIFRECLLGYTEPGVKVVGVYDGDTLIARSILRLVERDDGSAALHVERTYSQSASPVVLERTLELAVRKAEKMNMPVYLSHYARDEHGQRAGLKLPDGYEVTPDYRSLRVRNSRAPFVYVDSGDGKVSQGRYRIVGSGRLERAA